MKNKSSHFVVGAFYKLIVDRSKALALCTNDNSFTIFKGSTQGFQRSEVECKMAEQVGNTLILEDVISPFENGVCKFLCDYELSPLQATQFLSMRDDVVPEEYWEPVFPT